MTSSMVPAIQTSNTEREWKAGRYAAFHKTVADGQQAV
jgi:hypothetical protein